MITESNRHFRRVVAGVNAAEPSRRLREQNARVVRRIVGAKPGHADQTESEREFLRALMREHCLAAFLANGTFTDKAMPTGQAVQDNTVIDEEVRERATGVAVFLFFLRRECDFNPLDHVIG